MITNPKERPFHVESHLIVIQAHDADQALKGADLYSAIRVLSRLAHDLHDVVALALCVS